MSYTTRTGGAYFYFDAEGVVAGTGERDFVIHTGSMPVPGSFGAEVQCGPFLTLTYSKNQRRRAVLGERVKVTCCHYRRNGRTVVYADGWYVVGGAYPPAPVATQEERDEDEIERGEQADGWDLATGIRTAEDGSPVYWLGGRRVDADTYDKACSEADDVLAEMQDAEREPVTDYPF